MKNHHSKPLKTIFKDNDHFKKLPIAKQNKNNKFQISSIKLE